MATSVRTIGKIEWDAFVHQYGSIFNLSSWCDLSEKEYDIYGTFKGDELVGGVILDGFPITPYQGVVLKDNTKYSVTEALIKEIPEGFITNHYNFVDIRPFLWAGYTPYVRYTSVLDITDLDRVLKGMNKDTRYEARKPLDCTNGRPDDFWGLYVNMFERKKLELPISERFFYNLWTRIPCDIYRSKNASSVMMYEGDTAYYILGASEGTGESTALMWHAIQDLSRRGFKKLDFVGINVREIGLFKLGFGGEVKPLLGVTNV